MKYSVRVLAIVVALSLAGVAAGVSADADRRAAGLPDIMATAQMRHIKLWFAGKLSNWRLAGYELDKLESGLKQAEGLYPTERASEFAPKNLQSVRNAIEHADSAGFAKAFTDLTSDCNTCHRGLDFGFIAIQMPVASPFTDQLFVDQLAEGRALALAICGACHVISENAKGSPPVGHIPAPSFVELSRRQSFSQDALRQLLNSNHRYLGQNQGMPNPRLTNSQIEGIVALFETLRLSPQ
jgi:mono/diheme cytochrome c family protein